MLNVSSIPDFSVSVTPPSQSVTVGSAATYTATVTPLNGFTGSVTLSASGLAHWSYGFFQPEPAELGNFQHKREHSRFYSDRQFYDNGDRNFRSSATLRHHHLGCQRCRFRQRTTGQPVCRI